MADKPQYEQEYHAPKSDIPDPSVGEIFKGLFIYPFTWNARSTRKSFWVAFTFQFLLTFGIALLSILALATSGIFSVTPDNVTWAMTHINFLTWLIELILFILLIWIKLVLLGYAVRRLHDINYSGWWMWLVFIPFGWIIVFIFLLLPTVEEPVRWGSYLFTD